MSNDIARMAAINAANHASSSKGKGKEQELGDVWNDRIRRVMGNLPVDLTEQSRQYYNLVEKARQAHLEGDLTSSRIQLEYILSQENCPNVARIRAFQILRYVVPFHQATQPLDEALKICDAVEKQPGISLAGFKQIDAMIRAGLKAEASRREAVRHQRFAEAEKHGNRNHPGREKTQIGISTQEPTPGGERMDDDQVAMPNNLYAQIAKDLELFRGIFGFG